MSGLNCDRTSAGTHWPHGRPVGPLLQPPVRLESAPPVEGPSPQGLHLKFPRADLNELRRVSASQSPAQATPSGPATEPSAFPGPGVTWLT